MDLFLYDINLWTIHFDNSISKLTRQHIYSLHSTVVDATNSFFVRMSHFFFIFPAEI